MRSLKRGDLVFSSRYVAYAKWGIILEKVHDPLATSNKVFKVWWGDGTIGNNVWDYDLTLLRELQSNDKRGSERLMRAPLL